MIPLAEPFLGGNEQKYLDECVRTNFVSSVGPFVERFEQELAAYVGAKHAVACATGTAAIHVALRLFGVDVGDEVWVSDMTFIASANPILYERGTPVLVDAERSTWNLDPALVVEELDRRARTGAKLPKVMLPVHILGHPADLVPIRDACEKHGVVLVEDAAEALGATWSKGPLAGKHVGTVGKVGCFSFNGNKIITTGGGGMIVTDDPALAKRAKHLTTQARLPGAEYRHDEVGYNYRLTNVAAALGVAQLEQLPAFLAKKRAIAARYDEALGKILGVTLPPACDWAERSAWLYTALFEPPYPRDRTALMHHLGAAGIGARPVWTPLHGMPMYEKAPRLGTGAVGREVFDKGLSLPCSVPLGEDDQSRVIALLQR